MQRQWFVSVAIALWLLVLFAVANFVVFTVLVVRMGA